MPDAPAPAPAPEQELDQKPGLRDLLTTLAGNVQSIQDRGIAAKAKLELLTGQINLVVNATNTNAVCVGNISHFQGPYPLLMRRITGPAGISGGQFGPIFWLEALSPDGYPPFLTYLARPSPDREEAAVHLASLVNTSIPSLAPAWLNSAGQCGTDGCVPYTLTVQGERSLCALPGQPHKLMVLARIGAGRREYGKLAHQCHSGPHDNCSMWASSCELRAPGAKASLTPAAPVTQMSCAPGTGTNMLQALHGGLAGNSSGKAMSQQCSKWSAAELTNISDAAARSCTAPLPSKPGVVRDYNSGH